MSRRYAEILIRLEPHSVRKIRLKTNKKIAVSEWRVVMATKGQPAAIENRNISKEKK
jgi:hypothetical protein